MQTVTIWHIHNMKIFVSSTKVYGIYNDDSTAASLGFPTDTYYNIFIPLRSELKTEQVSVGPDLPDRPSKKTFVYVNPWTYWDDNTKLASIRLQRNYLLSQTDWTALNDVPLSPSEKQAYENYRQQLRDFPDTVNVNLPIEQIIWPTKP